MSLRWPAARNSRYQPAGMESGLCHSYTFTRSNAGIRGCLQLTRDNYSKVHIRLCDENVLSQSFNGRLISFPDLVTGVTSVAK